MSAWTDLEATGDSYDSGSDPFFTREVVQALGVGYLAGADPHEPYAAPAHADLDEFHGRLHTFQMAAGRSDAADEAIESRGSWLRSTLNRH